MEPFTQPATSGAGDPVGDREDEPTPGSDAGAADRSDGWADLPPGLGGPLPHAPRTEPDHRDPDRRDPDEPGDRSATDAASEDENRPTDTPDPLPVAGGDATGAWTPLDIDPEPAVPAEPETQDVRNEPRTTDPEPRPDLEPASAPDVPLATEVAPVPPVIVPAAPPLGPSVVASPSPHAAPTVPARNGARPRRTRSKSSSIVLLGAVVVGLGIATAALAGLVALLVSVALHDAG